MNEEKYYLRLNKSELLLLRKLLRSTIDEVAAGKRDWPTIINLYESLIGARFNLSAEKEIDAAVKKTKIYEALDNLGYFDYEEDNHDSTFYDLVCFLDDSGFEVFEELAEELKNTEKKNSKKDEQEIYGK